MSEALHQLIKSLSQTEKAYIKKFAHKLNSVKRDHYYKLFDTIDKQELYNERLVLKKVPQINSSKQLATAKNYLHNLILDCLCNYHRKNSVRAQVHQQLEQIEILCRKQLYKQALKIITKAKKTASKYELFPYLMQLQDWEEEILRVYAGRKTLRNYNILGFEQEFKTIEQWKNYRQYRQITNKFFAFEMKQSLHRNTEEQEELKQHIPLLKSPKQVLSNLAQSMRYYALSYAASLEQDGTGYEAEKAHLELLTKETDYRQLYPMRYICVLSNLSGDEAVQNHKTEAIHYLEMLEAVVPNSFEEAQFKNMVAVMCWLFLYAVTKTSAQHLDKIEALAQRFQKIPQLKHTLDYDQFMYLMAFNYFVAKDYPKVLHWYETYNQMVSKEPSLEYSIGIRLLSIISNYELGQDFFVNYQGDSTYRYIRKQGEFYKIESALVLFLKRMVNLPERSAKMVHFQQFKQEMEDVDSHQTTNYGLFNPMDWVNDKITEYSTSSLS